MAHIFCITSGLTGILHASFEMFARLEAAGHQITCASPADVGEKVKAQGFNFIQLHPLKNTLEPELPKFEGLLRKWKRMWIKIREARQRRRVAITALGMDQYKAILQELSPDLVIIDVELHQHIMTTFSLKFPMILLSQWFSLWKCPGLPPLLHDTIPGIGWSGSKVGLKLAWLKIKIRRWYIFQKKKWRSVRTDRRSILLAYAQQVGFPLAYIKENYWPGPFTYDVLPVISMTAKEMEFPHIIRPALHYVGPMVNAERKEVITNFEKSSQIKTILEGGKASNKKIIYCSVSTFKDGDIPFLKKVIQAVEDQNKWVLIVGLGGRMDKKSLGRLPSNVHVFSWVPQLQVLQVADCSINHGGIHTINECIHFKVPMLVYSGKRSDQNGCAARVAFHGLGIMADKDRDDDIKIRNNIQQVLKNEYFRENLKKMHEHYKNYKIDKTLNQTIAQFIEGR